MKIQASCDQVEVLPAATLESLEAPTSAFSLPMILFFGGLPTRFLGSPFLFTAMVRESERFRCSRTIS